jgi:hypothetical protein
MKSAGVSDMLLDGGGVFWKYKLAQALRFVIRFVTRIPDQGRPQRVRTGAGAGR